MAPKIEDGEFVIVSPNSELVVNENVLVKLTDGRKMVKKLRVKRGGYYEVESINGGERMLFRPDEIEAVHAVKGVLPPSAWRPE